MLAVGVVSGWLTGTLAVYFFLYNDFTLVFAGDFLPLQSLALWIQENRPDSVRLSSPHSNLIAQTVIVLLPFGTAGIIWLWQQGWRVLAAVTVLPLVVGASGIGHDFFARRLDWAVHWHCFWHLPLLVCDIAARIWGTSEWCFARCCRNAGLYWLLLAQRKFPC